MMTPLYQYDPNDLPVVSVDPLQVGDHPDKGDLFYHVEFRGHPDTLDGHHVLTLCGMTIIDSKVLFYDSASLIDCPICLLAANICKPLRLSKKQRGKSYDRS